MNPALSPSVWRPRRVPLKPVAVAAEGESARLLTRLLERTDEELLRLRGIRAPSVPAVLLSGEGDDLPWADGVVYLGKDDLAPALLVPSLLEPRLPLALLERAILSRFASLGTPVAVLPGARLRLFPMGGARPLSRARLDVGVSP
jgi:MoxR-vWA-beta-propeller ternary system domain bpX5